MAEEHERVGEIVAGSYRLVRVLGEGGMGTVYEAQHLRLDRRFAVKVLKPEIAANAEMFDRFRREAEISSASRHENVVEVFDFNVDKDGAPYIVMEFLEGETLADRVARRGRLGLEETARVVEEAASGLEATHARGVVHRDLKPQNLFLVRRAKRHDFVKILDFGISKVLHVEGDFTTKQGSVLGTPNYMAPEQLEGGDVDARTDVWALGAIVYECLTGQRAFSGPTIPGVLYAVCHAEPRPLRELAPEVSQSVADVIARAIRKKRSERYETADAFRRAFLTACGRAVSIAPGPSGSPTQPGVPTLSVDAKIVVRSMDTGDGSAPTMAAIGLGAQELGASMAATPATLGTASHAMAVPRATKARWPLVMLGAIVVAGAVGTVVWRGSVDRRAPSAPLAPAAADSGPAAPSVVPAAAASIELHLRIEPANASVLLDGTPVTPPLRLPRADVTHVLVVRAEGYAEVTRTIRADADADLAVRLEKLAEPAATAKTPPTSWLATKPTSKPATSTAKGDAGGSAGKPPATAVTGGSKIDIKGPLEKEL